MKNFYEYYTNRELSWLDFNDRVLDEAYDKTNKILARLKFLSITASNLDEFYMVRVSGLKQQVLAGYNKKDPSNLTPKKQLEYISKRVKEIYKKQYRLLMNYIIPELENEGIFLKKYSDLSKHDRNIVNSYFDEFCFPALTPLAVDSSRPFPLLLNNSLNIVVSFKDTKDSAAIVRVPPVLPRFFEFKTTNTHCFIYLEEIIIGNIKKLFSGYEVKNAFTFRVTRDADLDIDEDETEDLLIEIEKNIKKRKWGIPVRLELSKGYDKRTKNFLIEKLELKEEDVYVLNGPLDLTYFIDFIKHDDYYHLIDILPRPQEAIDFFGCEDIFETIKTRDRLIHLPYESFDKVLEFIDTAVNDPNVLAIKQTLYRVSENSPIIDKLITAVENGKEVTVVVELKARFDEENNIEWAKKLERAGCHVVYGLPNLKIHSKAILIVRKEEEGIRRYVHLSTGNYNDLTAKLYTDINLFTCRETIAKDVSAMFNIITGYTKYNKWNKLFIAPFTLRKGFEYLINREIENVKERKNGHIIAKFNSLVDQKIIEKLYEASNAGVKIDLIVRGICCLKPGIPDVSENIKVISIIGSFLEHSRIYYFFNDGNKDIYLSSADWMERNLNRRIETLFPVEEPLAKERIFRILDVNLRDTVKARSLTTSGIYKRVDKRGKELINSQERFSEDVKNAIFKYNQNSQ